ncbi:HNH endonuclease [Oerskovia sp. NPDC060338]|uniref:HNH endonuclease n=1 Tax=Oerskovia sp. NPDC060338 TaxID=3347100 RepID=UPI003661C363
MPYFMSDDQLPVSRKVKKLTAPVLAGDHSGLAALGMWNLAGASSQATGTDGLVSIVDLIGTIYVKATAEQLAHLLVDAGLWHAPGHDCPRCDPVPAGHYRFHDWWDMRYKPAAVMREAWAKGKENKLPHVVNAVWWRDCIDPTDPKGKNRARCRYCKREVNRYDASSKDLDGRPQLDHVDPAFAGGVTNLVVSCAGCNRRKGARTPDDAGMTLYPAPRAPQEQDTAAVASPGTPAADTTPATAHHTHTTAPAPAEPTPALAAPVAPVVASEPSLREASLEASPEGPLAHVHARGPGRAPGSGSGTGSGQGEGVGEGSAQRSTSRSRRRRRGRGGKPTTNQARPPSSMNAGPAPVLHDPPTGGSPWKTWSGPASPISTENVCAFHGHHLPCRSCATPGGTP